MLNSRLKALTLLLLLGFIWGTGYSIARFATLSDVSPLGYSFWQALGPALLLGFLIGKPVKTLTLKTSAPYYYFICGLFGIVIPNTNMYFVASHLPAGLLAVIVNTVPIIAYPLALFSRTEHFDFLRLIGVLFAFMGLMLIIVPNSHLPTSTMMPYAIQALITPISFAFSAIYIARFKPKNVASMPQAASTLLMASIILTPIILLSKQFYGFHLPFHTVDYIILLEIILSSIGYILFFKLIQMAGVVYYSFVDSIVALTGLFWGYIIFHETLNQRTALAVFLILIALWMVTQRQRRLIAREAELC